MVKSKHISFFIFFNRSELQNLLSVDEKSLFCLFSEQDICNRRRNGRLGIYTDVTEVYDPTTDTMETKTSMLTARFVLGVAVVNNSLYAIGGHEGWFGTSISAANERYTPADFMPEFLAWKLILFPLAVLACRCCSYLQTKTTQKPICRQIRPAFFAFFQ